MNTKLNKLLDVMSYDFDVDDLSAVTFATIYNCLVSFVELNGVLIDKIELVNKGYGFENVNSSDQFAYLQNLKPPVYLVELSSLLLEIKIRNEKKYNSLMQKIMMAYPGLFKHILKEITLQEVNTASLLSRLSKSIAKNDIISFNKNPKKVD